MINSYENILHPKYQESVKKAKEAGYSDEEIQEFLLKKQDSKYSEGVKKAKEAGYTDQEIDEYLSGSNVQKQEPVNQEQQTQKHERSFGEKAGRVAGQFALGAAQSNPLGMAYDVGTALEGSKGGQFSRFKQGLSSRLEDLAEKKYYSQDSFTDEDQAELDQVMEQVKDPIKHFEPQDIDVGIEGLVNKATGIDTEPEGFLEKASRWYSYIRNPKNLKDVKNILTSPGKLIKAILPGGKEAARSGGAAAAWEFAEEGNLGPIGQIAASIGGDLAGASTFGSAKGLIQLAKNPKASLADVISFITPDKKRALLRDISESFKKSGIEPNLGTITDNDLIRMVESRVAQSALLGSDYREMFGKIKDQILTEYDSLANNIGEYKAYSHHEAGQALQNMAKKVKDVESSNIRELYEKSRNLVKEGESTSAGKLDKHIDNTLKNIQPGSVKSGEQSKVVTTLENLRKDIQLDGKGNKSIGLVEAMNNKIALNDLINYETQGGAKKLLRGLVSEIDRTLISHAPKNKKFVDYYIASNKEFSKHAKEFRNKNINDILFSQKPEQLLNKMNTVQGVKDIEKVLSKNPEARQLWDELKRFKFDDLVQKHLVDGANQQIKYGTFPKFMEKGKNREVIKSIMDPASFNRLETLQKNVGYLNDSMKKFYNPSGTANVGVDVSIGVGLVTKAIYDIGHLMNGNPWPLVKTGVGVTAILKSKKLLTDPQFLRLTEEAVTASKSGSKKRMQGAFDALIPYVNSKMNEDEKE